jgi:biopolymer transport protein ExbD
MFEPEVTSFADIAVLLIIFFILTTTFVVPAGNRLEIPSATQDPAKSQQKPPTVTLAGSDIMYGPRGDRISLEGLRRQLLAENFKAKPPDRRIVVVTSRPDVAYQLYFDVVMAITDAEGVLAIIEDEGKGKE